MDYVHDCFFCGWRREARSATVLEPHCEQCGCAVRSGSRLSLAGPASHLRRVSKPSGIPLAARLATALFAMVTAAHAGYAEAGPAIGLAAFGAAGLISVPLLVPSR